MSDMAQVMKRVANAYMSATLAKRVVGDVVRTAPFPVLSVVSAVSIAAGLVWGRRRRRH
jgi:hypothetical protein